MNFKHAVISFWYKELKYNPICKVGSLENSLSNYLKAPFLINKEEPLINIGLPRIMASGEDDKYHYNFNMSLVNAILNISFNNLDKDEVILKINEMIQVIYDILKEIYDLEVVYSSIKLDYFEYIDDSQSIQKQLLSSIDNNLEDFMVKRSLCYENKYYFNEITTVTKEVNIDISFPNGVKPNDADMMARSMLVSLKDGRVVGNIKNTSLEINDRLSYNNDPLYRVDKEKLRNLFFEFKLNINKYIK